MDSPSERLKADALFAASRAFSLLDVEFALALQARYRWHALCSGDPERWAIALACAGSLCALFNQAVGNFFSMNAFEPLFWKGCVYLLVRIINAGSTVRSSARARCS